MFLFEKFLKESQEINWKPILNDNLSFIDNLIFYNVETKNRERFKSALIRELQKISVYHTKIHFEPPYYPEDLEKYGNALLKILGIQKIEKLYKEISNDKSFKKENLLFFLRNEINNQISNDPVFKSVISTKNNDLKCLNVDGPLNDNLLVFDYSTQFEKNLKKYYGSQQHFNVDFKDIIEIERLKEIINNVCGRVNIFYKSIIIESMVTMLFFDTFFNYRSYENLDIDFHYKHYMIENNMFTYSHGDIILPYIRIDSQTIKEKPIDCLKLNIVLCTIDQLKEKIEDLKLNCLYKE